MKNKDIFPVSKIVFLVTTISQAVYSLFIALNFLCIWMFTAGVPYIYPIAILGHVFLMFCPIELYCLIPNLIFLIKTMKSSPTRSQKVVAIILVFVPFILLCVIKVGLFFYANSLAPVV